MMYLFDKELRLIDIIGRDNIISFNYEREKNGLYFIEAVLPLSKTNKDGYVNLHAKLNKATYVGHHDKDGRFQMHRTIVLEIEKDEIFLRGVHLFFDEAKAFGVVKTRIFKDSEVSQVAPYLFSPLGWKLHSSDPSPSRTITFDDISVLEARKMLIEVYGFEFDYWFDFDGQKITGKWYTIKRQIGKETYKRYRYGSNALNVKAEEDYSEVYTAVIGKGALLEPIERAAAQKKYEADKKRVEAEQQRIKDAYKKAKAAHEADRKATIRKYEAAVADWRKKRDAITKQRKARTKRKRVKGKKLPKLPRLVTPPKPKYPKAKPAPKQGKLPKLPKRPEDAKAPSKDEAKDERRVEFTNVVWKKPTNPLDKPKGQRVLVDPVTTDLFGYRDASGKRVPKTAVVVFDDVADPAKVLSLSYNWLKENNRPKAIFSVEVADDEPLDLGDTVHIIYKEANQVHASRVFKVRDNLIADTRSVEFGDGEHFTKDGKVAKIGKDVQSLRRRVKDEIYARKVEFDTEFDRQVQLIQEAYDEALADALVEVDALAEAITTEIDTAQEDFIDDIEAAITLAEVEAEERAEELEGMLIDELAEQKSYLQEEIKQSYDKAVSAATEKAEEKGREIDGLIRKESETLKSDIAKATVAAEEAAKEAAKEVTQTIEADVKGAKELVAKLSGDTASALGTAKAAEKLVTDAKKNIDELVAWRGAKGALLDRTADAVTQKVWQKDIDSLVFDNRNILINSNDFSIYTPYAGYKRVIQTGVAVDEWGATDATRLTYTKTGNTLYGGLATTPQIRADVGREITFSFWVKNMSDKKVRMGFNGLSVTSVSHLAWLEPKESIRYSVTGKMRVDYDWFQHQFYPETEGEVVDVILWRAKVEYGNKATPWSKAPEDVEAKVVTVEQTANAAKTQAEAIGKDYVKQSSVSVASDGVVIGSKKIGGDSLASAIAVTPSNVDIITKAMRVTGDMKVAGDIKSLSLAAVNADIANLRTKIVTANSIDATKIKVDAALLNKLDTSEILSKKIIASKAFLDEVKAKSIAATRGDIAWLRSNVITADSVDATALKVDTALADKLFATDVLTTKLVADSTYSKSVKALAVEAARADIGWLKTNVLTANSIGTAALQANSVSADKLKVDTAFVNKLMADKALVDSLKAKSMEAVNANIGTLRTSILSANVVKASNIASDNAMIDKLFASEALVSRLTAKGAFIKNIQAIDINLNRATVKGTTKDETTVLSGGKIRSTGTFTRTFPQGSATYEAYTESWNGTYRAGLISKSFGKTKLTDIDRWLSLNDKSVTTQREIHSASPDKRGARFIDFFAEETYSSDVSGQGMHIYSGQAMRIESEYGLYLNANKRFYIRTEDSGLEINRNGQNLVLKRTSPFTSTVGSGGSYMSIQSSDGVEQAHVGILSNKRDLSLRSSYGDVLLKGTKVFALDPKGSNRVPMYAQYFSGEKVIGNIEAADTNIYAMCHDELRVVSKAGYNGGNPQYKNLRFGSWNAMSHEKFKHDIEKWDYNVLDLYRHELELHRYKVNHETNRMYHHGIVLRENVKDDKFPVEWRNGDGYDGTEVLWWNTKAIQELAFENDALKRWVQDEMSQLSTSLRELKQQNEALRKEVEQLKTQTMKGGV